MNDRRCEECENFCYDEETDEWYCDHAEMLDEDDIASLTGGRPCPLFRWNDEYRIVRKQN